VFGTATKGVDIQPAEIPIVNFTHDGKWALGLVINGTQRELGLFVAPQAGVLAGKPAWKRVLKPSDEVTGLTYFDDTLYLVSHQGAPRSKVLAMQLKTPDQRQAELVMPPSERVVVNVAAAADALYIEARNGPTARAARRWKCRCRSKARSASSTTKAAAVRPTRACPAS
jgi:prolyl oligopeptidase